MYALLDNIMWNTLSGRHLRHSAGCATARRYARGFSPIVGFPDPTQPDLTALRPHCEVGERFYCDRWAGAAPAGWSIEVESLMLKMVWSGGTPPVDAAPDAIPLGAAHLSQALALTVLTRPGPFGPRTIELGEYFGLFDGERLLAMAGERMHAGSLHEISAVCTHPDAQGRGLARRLTQKLIQRQLQRGETPFLHVMSDNRAARSLYERLGFSNYLETVVRVIAPL
jgi:GNAT superfamily N-acetyltransferase